VLSLERTESGEYVELLAFEAKLSPTIQYLLHCIAFRAEHPDEALPELDPTIASTCGHSAELLTWPHSSPSVLPFLP
jgi:hypothetical protein